MKMLQPLSISRVKQQNIWNMGAHVLLHGVIRSSIKLSYWVQVCKAFVYMVNVRFVSNVNNFICHSKKCALVAPGW